MTKEFLKEHIDKLKEKKQLEDEIDALYIMMKSPVITGMPGRHSSNKDKVGDVVARLEEKEARYLGKLAVILDEEIIIDNAIETLSISKERTVMRYRYIEGCKWEEICVKANYSWKQLHRIHSDALKKLKIIKDDIE